jgi:hypothetical protein
MEMQTQFSILPVAAVAVPSQHAAMSRSPAGESIENRSFVIVLVYLRYRVYVSHTYGA